MRKAYTLLRRAGSVLRRFTSKTTIVRQYAERFGNPRRRSSGTRTQNAAWAKSMKAGEENVLHDEARIERDSFPAVK